MEIEDAAEYAFIIHYVTGIRGTDWLIGATDKAVEGELVWMTSKKTLSQSFSNWYPGQPGNHNHDESCICLSKSAPYKWEDISCETRRTYICETQQSAGPSLVASVVG